MKFRFIVAILPGQLLFARMALLHADPDRDAMLLGSLIKQMKAVDLLRPSLPRPVYGVSVATAVKEITNLSSLRGISVVERESVEDDGITAKKKKKAAKGASMWSGLDEDNTRLYDRCEEHPFTLGVLFR